jgi:hypothetical protein
MASVLGGIVWAEPPKTDELVAVQLDAPTWTFVAVKASRDPGYPIGGYWTAMVFNAPKFTQ